MKLGYFKKFIGLGPVLLNDGEFVDHSEDWMKVIKLWLIKYFLKKLKISFFLNFREFMNYRLIVLSLEAEGKYLWKTERNLTGTSSGGIPHSKIIPPTENCGWKCQHLLGRLLVLHSGWWLFSPSHVPWLNVWAWTWEKSQVGKCISSHARGSASQKRAHGTPWTPVRIRQKSQREDITDDCLVSKFWVLRAGSLPRDTEGTALPTSLEHRQ